MSSNNFQRNYVDTLMLGEKSYNAVLNRIYQTLLKSKAQTIEGSEFLKNMYADLNESITPMLTLKPFITKGEELAQNDMSVAQVINIIKKSINGNADLNFLINMCKEEHFANMNRAGVPSPEETVKSIKEKFSLNDKDTRKLINDGIFDCLQSSLLGDIKKKLGYSENQSTKKSKDIVPLKESDAIFDGNGVVSYSPIGFIIKSDDGRNYGFMEGKFVALDKKDKHGMELEMSVVNGDNMPEVTDVQRKLMRAIENCVYNPNTNEFEPKMSWDMEPKLDADGGLTIKLKDGKRVSVKSKDMQNLFIESLDLYDYDPTVNNEYSKAVRDLYVRDADDFCMLAMNMKSLVRFNNIKTVRKLNENAMDTVVMIDGTSQIPTVLSFGNEDNKSFGSYRELCESCNQMIGSGNYFQKMFMSNLNEEQELLAQKRVRLTNLNERQKEINQTLKSIQSMKAAAEPGSPALAKLNEREEKFNRLLEDNINEIQSLNESTLY